MKERPILFKGEMVRAILEGRKTQTRRIVKGKGKIAVLQQSCGPMVLDDYSDETNTGNFVKYPYGQPGDHLWVKETFSAEGAFGVNGRKVYRADIPSGKHPSGLDWKPSIFMPRKASRITVEIVSVRVERLNEISEEDAKAEGVEPFAPDDCRYKQGYQELWESINGADAWALNPWVWVITFKKL